MSKAPRTYLDFNATAPLRPEARAAMLAALDAGGNPSSVHGEGRAARALVEAARRDIAAGLGTALENLVFTSGATEAANLALTPSIRAGKNDAPFDTLLAGAGEHPAVLSGHRFPAERMEKIALRSDGVVSLEALAASLDRHRGKRVMLALQAANSETGVIQPVSEAARLVHEAGGILVCDAAQAVGRIEITFASTGADMIFFSSHKLGGPSGAGALAIARGDLHIKEALLRGGGQESGRRAGTENVAAIAGFAAAYLTAERSREAEGARLSVLRDEIERRVASLAPDALFFGAAAERLPGVSAFAIRGAKAETVVMALDLEGVAVSSGSACSSGKVGASHVLEAMGAGELAAGGAVRVSLGWSSISADAEAFGAAFARVLERIRMRLSAA